MSSLFSGHHHSLDLEEAELVALKDPDTPSDSDDDTMDLEMFKQTVTGTLAFEVLIAIGRKLSIRPAKEELIQKNIMKGNTVRSHFYARIRTWSHSEC